MEERYFEDGAAFRRWLAKHHDSEEVLWVGYHKRATGRASMTWNESVDEALCYGWIDGLRQSVDDERYRIRFTPRKPRSIWSAKNIARVEELVEEGRMKPPGLAAFERRREHRSRRYSFEQGEIELPAEYRKKLRANREAWAFYTAQPPGYHRQTTWWIISAKRATTRERRLARLIEDSANGVRIKELRR